jgi:membrane protein
MLEPRKYLQRMREVPGYYLSGIYRQILEKNIFLFAQAIAFKVIVTIVPLVILATGVLGQLLRGEEAFAQVAEYIYAFLPDYGSEQLVTFLFQLQGASGTITIIGVGGLLITVMTLFTTLRMVISSIFREEWHVERSILWGYAFDLRMVGQVGLLFLLSFGLSLIVQTLNVEGGQLIRSLGLDYYWIREGWMTVFRLVGLLLPLVLSIAMFFQLYYFIPKPHPPRRSAVVGAVVTALLWEIAKYGFTFYATRAGQFDRYVAEPGVEVATDGAIALAMGSLFGLIIAFGFWIYYSGLVLSLGAIVVLLHEKRQRVKRRKESMAAQTKKPERAIEGEPDPMEEALAESASTERENA